MARILVIDDDEQVRRLLKMILQSKGYEVWTAGEGGEGLALHRAVHPDLILMDIVMPGQEGFETIRNLRQEFPKAKIIAFSGKMEDFHCDLLGIAKRFGACQTLAKPFEVLTLLNLVRDTLNESRKEEGAPT